jgi:hypothetical protein
MNISEINDVVFEYLVKLIKYYDVELDIYNITEDQFEENIIQNMLNRWSDGGGYYDGEYYDIITEYFGNQSTFIPSLVAFVEMLEFITQMRRELEMPTPITLFGRNNPRHTYCNVLRHYAYWYITTMGYENFLLKLKDYVDNDEDE